MKFNYIFTILFLFSLLLTATSAQNNNTNRFLKCLTSQIQASNATHNVIFSPSLNASSYSSIFQSLIGNLRHISTQTPIAIITPNHESQIQATIRCARKYDVEIKVRSGGHDYEGLSYVAQVSFVVIDMRNLRSITINTKEKTAWIQTGATLGELYYTIAQRSRTLGFPGGVCSTVGVGGHVSGGGYGMMARKYGLAIDNIIDAVIINVDGEILDSKAMGADLFWAIRGGGGASFGVVLAYKVNLVAVPEIVTVFNVSRTSEQNVTDLIHRWQFIADVVDENLLLTVFMRSIRTPGSSNDNNRTSQGSFLALFLGRADTLFRIMEQSYPELGIVREDLTEMSWIQSTLYFWRFPPGTPTNVLLNRTQAEILYFKGKSDFARKPIHTSGLQGMLDYMNEEDTRRTEIQFSPYGGAITRVPDAATPFPHRRGNLYIIHYGIWTPTNLPRHVNWIRRLYAYMAPFVAKNPRTAYINYRDLDIGRNNFVGNTSYKQASVWGRKYYQNNFNRLVRVKTKVDPSNFFRNEQSIPAL